MPIESRYSPWHVSKEAFLGSSRSSWKAACKNSQLRGHSTRSWRSPIAFLTFTSKWNACARIKASSTWKLQSFKIYDRSGSSVTLSDSGIHLQLILIMWLRAKLAKLCTISSSLQKSRQISVSPPFHQNRTDGMYCLSVSWRILWSVAKPGESIQHRYLLIIAQGIEA